MTFSYIGSLPLVFCISRTMSRYAYQIQGILENAKGEFNGLRVLVCDLYNLDSVDVPVEILDRETALYIQFRINVTTTVLNVKNLPNSVQRNIREPLGRWLDRWVLENFYGDISNTKDINT